MGPVFTIVTPPPVVVQVYDTTQHNTQAHVCCVYCVVAVLVLCTSQRHRMIHRRFRRPIYAARYICLQTPFNMLIDIYININVCSCLFVE